MGPRDRATAVTVTNDSDEQLVMQADVYAWKQKPGGEDELTLSEDLFLAPPIIKLAPRARQVVRLAMVSPPKSRDQLTYRMILREIVEARPVEKNVEVSIALAFSLPVFITPPGAKSRLSCDVARTAADAVTVECQNSGNAYAQAREFALMGVGGDKLAGRDSGGYILPGITRSFGMKRAGGPIPAGKAKLTASLDDGSTRTFDVLVAE
jgi:fimbrial chaperone protein